MLCLITYHEYQAKIMVFEAHALGIISTCTWVSDWLVTLMFPSNVSTCLVTRARSPAGRHCSMSALCCARAVGGRHGPPPEGPPAPRRPSAPRGPLPCAGLSNERYFQEEEQHFHLIKNIQNILPVCFVKTYWIKICLLG